MKKFLSLCLAFSLCFGMFARVSGFAGAVEEDAVITIGTVTGNQGEVVTIPVSVQTAVAVNAIALSGITFDESALEFVGFADYEHLETMLPIENFVDVANKTILAPMRKSAVFDGDFCSLQFKIKDTAEGGSYTISASSVVKNGSTAYTSAVQSGAIEVAARPVDANFTIGTGAGKPGDVVTVSVMLDSSVKINSIGITGITFDESALEFVGFADYEHLETLLPMEIFLDTEKRTIVAPTTTTEVFDGAFCSLQFKIKDTAADGTYEISAESLVKNGATVYTSTVQSGWVRVDRFFEIVTRQPANGRVSASVSEAKAGTEVVLSATADAGYELDTFLVNGAAIYGNTFAMPEENVTVSAKFVPIDYTVSVVQGENGNITVDRTVANIGDTVTVTGAADEGYELSKILVNGTEISGNTFTVPAQNVTVTAEFTKILYRITWLQPENGKVSASASAAGFDTVVTLSATADAGYKLDTFLVSGAAIEGNTFVMPKRAVSVSAEFVPIDYTVSVVQGENGSITVDRAVANVGDAVTVTGAADEGYELSKVLVNGSEISGNTFTMPAEDVTVTAEFTKIRYPITVEQTEQGKISTDKTAATFDEIVTISAAPNAGYRFSRLRVNGTVIDGNAFVMPKAAATVRAEFVAIDYNVSVGEAANGVIGVDKAIAHVGDEIAVRTEAEAGYELSKILVNGIEIGGNTFTMPAQDVTVTAAFVKKPYNITVVKPENGQIMTDKTSATFDEIVTVTTIVPSIGYTFAHAIVDGTVIDGKSFVMPKHDVTVSAIFEKIKYPIKVTESDFGSLTVVAEAAEGDAVTVTATPKQGYALVSILVDGAVIEGNTFTMPAGEVTVSAEYEQLFVKGDVDLNGSVDINDAVLLFQHSMLPDVYPIEYAGSVDFDGDGVIDINDAVLLFQHSMLPDLYPLA